MFSTTRSLVITALLLALLGTAFLAARPSNGAGTGNRYVVKPGDTLWSIARAGVGDGNLRRAVWDLRERNDLPRGKELVPGTVLVLP